LREQAANGKRVVPVSGLKKLGLNQLLIAIECALVADPLVTSSFKIPQSEGSVLAALDAGSTILNKTFDGNLVFVTARGPASLIDRYRSFRAKE
jgi:GTP-binding protein HflX